MATRFEQRLQARLAGVRRLAILAVGSDLRGDDAAGLLAAREFERLIRRRQLPTTVAVFYGETAPENFTGEIKRFSPTHLVVLDAADFGRRPGYTGLIDLGCTGVANASASTHALPISILADYFGKFMSCEFLVAGIQPDGCGFGEPVTAAVRRAARLLASQLADAIRG